MFDEKKDSVSSEPLNAEPSSVEAWGKSRASTAVESQPKNPLLPKEEKKGTLS